MIIIADGHFEIKYCKLSASIKISTTERLGGASGSGQWLVVIN
jgi:hypothetical protein